MFVQMAAEIIAKQMTMIILQTILKALGAVGGGGGGGDSTKFGLNTPDMQKYAPLPGAANGATFASGIATFAKGGAFTNSVVSGPTMFEFADGGMMKPGLMGEAGPEAIMPLSRGAGGRLGVDASGLRESMDRQASTAPVSPVLNMSFESTSINGVEYVSRDQLEQAMAETRRAASRDGAQRGMTMTLDKLQQSPATRSKIGLR
jgi:phage-related minor tail protein